MAEEEEKKGGSKGSGFGKLVFGVVAGNGYDTTDMEFEEALEIFNKLGGENNWKAKELKLKDKEDREKAKRSGGKAEETSSNEMHGEERLNDLQARNIINKEQADVLKYWSKQQNVDIEDLAYDFQSQVEFDGVDPKEAMTNIATKLGEKEVKNKFDKKAFGIEGNERPGYRNITQKEAEAELKKKGIEYDKVLTSAGSNDLHYYKDGKKVAEYRSSEKDFEILGEAEEKSKPESTKEKLERRIKEFTDKAKKGEVKSEKNMPEGFKWNQETNSYEYAGANVMKSFAGDGLFEVDVGGEEIIVSSLDEAKKTIDEMNNYDGDIYDDGTNPGDWDTISTNDGDYLTFTKENKGTGKGIEKALQKQKENKEKLIPNGLKEGESFVLDKDGNKKVVKSKTNAKIDKENAEKAKQYEKDRKSAPAVQKMLNGVDDALAQINKNGSALVKDEATMKMFKIFGKNKWNIERTEEGYKITSKE